MHTTLRVAVVGGDERIRTFYPPRLEVRRYGSRKCRGNGGLKQALATIRVGGLDAVVLLVRWLGHPASRAVRGACKRAGIPCAVVTGGESSARRVVLSIAHRCRP